MSTQFKSVLFDNKECLTTNGAVSNASSNNNRVSLFYKSVRGLDSEILKKYLSDASTENIIDTISIIFNTRDCRGGKGEREIGRQSFKWLSDNHPEKFNKVFHLIPEYGRWDDLTSFTSNPLVVKFYADQLNKDTQNMLEGKGISLAAKWFPSEHSALNKKTKFFQSVCKELEISPKNMRQSYLTPLRSYLNVVETFMCSKQWEQINLSNVPSCAIKRLKKTFQKHMPETFNIWVSNVASGKKSVKASTLFPNELVLEQLEKANSFTNVECQLIEEQWKVLEKMYSDNLDSSLVVVDVSGSMMDPKHIPISVSLSLGLILSKANKGALHNHVVTFEEKPIFVELKKESFLDRINELKNIAWGGNTNIQAVFDLLLTRATTKKLKDQDIPKTIWIISDMQFDSCGSLTNFQKINDNFTNAGYKRPNIVFWNVTGKYTDFPVTVDDNGTCLISGFSPTIVKYVLSAKEFSTDSIMRSVIDSERYKPVRESLEKI